MSDERGYSPSFKRPAEVMRMRRKRARSEASPSPDGGAAEPTGPSPPSRGRPFAPGPLFSKPSRSAERRNPFANIENRFGLLGDDGEEDKMEATPEGHLQTEAEDADVASCSSFPGDSRKSPPASEGDSPLEVKAVPTAPPLCTEYPSDWSLKTRLLFSSSLTLSWSEQPKAQEEALGLSWHCRTHFTTLPHCLQGVANPTGEKIVPCWPATSPGCTRLLPNSVPHDPNEDRKGIATKKSNTYLKESTILTKAPRREVVHGAALCLPAESGLLATSQPALGAAVPQDRRRAEVCGHQRPVGARLHAAAQPKERMVRTSGPRVSWRFREGKEMICAVGGRRSASLSSLYSLLKAKLCPYFYVCAHQFTVLFRAAGVGGSSSITATMCPTSRGLRHAMKAEGIHFTSPLLEQRRKTTEQQDEEDGGSGLTWLEEIGVQDKIRKPDGVFMQRSKEGGASLDHKPESVVCMEGAHTFTLINFLINCKSVVATAGSQAGLPPTLLAPVAFRGAAVHALKARCMNMKSQVGSTYQNISSLEIAGPVLPSSLHAIAALLGPAQKGNFSATLYTHTPTAALNVHPPQQQCESDSADLSQCGLHPDSVRQLRRPSGLGKTALTQITMRDYSYTWKT